MKHLRLHIVSLFIACIAGACGLAGTGSKGVTIDEPPGGGDTLTANAQLLTLVDHGKYVTADVADPWHPGKLMARYVLVDRNKPMPDTLPKGTVVKVPLESSVVYSAVHVSAIDELGGIKGVKGVADLDYATPLLAKNVRAHNITDIGSSMSPSTERIIALEPDALLVSPFENAGHGVIENLGVPIIECADYMEASPMARAEWILFMGELYGARDKAQQIFQKVKSDYTSLRDSISQVRSAKPKVITESMQQGVWFVPGGRSYMARLLADAGASYPWKDDKSSGSLQLDFGAVYERAHDADIWLIRTYGQPLTLSALKADNALNARFKPFTTGNVWYCNTAESTFFDDLPFHPERVLREFASIFHPNEFNAPTKYYSKAR